METGRRFRFSPLNLLVILSAVGAVVFIVDSVHLVISVQRLLDEIEHQVSVLCLLDQLEHDTATTLDLDAPPAPVDSPLLSATFDQVAAAAAQLSERPEELRFLLKTGRPQLIRLQRLRLTLASPSIGEEARAGAIVEIDQARHEVLESVHAAVLALRALTADSATTLSGHWNHLSVIAIVSCIFSLLLLLLLILLRVTAARRKRTDRIFREIAESIDELFWVISPDEQRLIYANPAYERITGVSLSELGNDPSSWINQLRPEDRGVIEDRVRSMPAGERREHRSTEFRILRPDGETRWVLVRSHPVFAENGEMIARAGVGMDITEHRRAERQARELAGARRLLLEELNHRVRNNLASLLSLVNLSKSSTTTRDEFAAAVASRVRAMSRVHDLLNSNPGRATTIETLVRTFVPPGTAGTVHTDGPIVSLPPQAATALAMIMNELISNGLKHGPLHLDDGCVHVSWVVEHEDPDKAIRMNWRESGGAIADSEIRPGSGTELIKGLVRFELRGDVTFRFLSQGVDHELVIRLGSDDEFDSFDSLAEELASPIEA